MQPDEFLDKHGLELEGLEFCYGVDNNQNPPELFEKARLRVLIVFFSTGPTRAVSNTYTVLDNIIKSQYGEDVFVDTVYLPTMDDLKVFQKAKMPFLFGNVSHRFYTEYDLILGSVSILCEVYNVAFFLQYNGISLDFETRLVDKQSPAWVFGGVVSPFLDIMYGPHDEGSGCLVDSVFIGHPESGGMSDIIDTALEVDSRTRKEEFLLLLANRSPHVLIPGWYDVDYRVDEDVGYFIENVTPQKGMRDAVHMAHVHDINEVPGFEKKIFNTNGEQANSGDLDISSGCSSNACTFCSEGLLGGAWKQRTLENLLGQMRTLRLAAAPNTIGFFSFNLNYYGGFLDLIIESARRFSNLSLINQRADVIGADKRYLQLAKSLGLRRASMALEGMGERIRNGLFNKNLDFSQWKAAMRVVFELRLAESKSGMIWSGYETEEDFQESLGEFKEIIKMRDELGANTAVRVTITPLVIYPFGPLERMKRITAIHSLTRQRGLKTFIYGLKDLGIRMKINARGRSTFMDQFVVDYGRIGTKYIVRASKNYPAYYGGVSRASENVIIDGMTQDGLPVAAFLNERPSSHKLWSCSVDALSKKYVNRWIARARKLPEIGFSVRQCTTSPANKPALPGARKLSKYVASCGACNFCEDEAKRKGTKYKKEVRNVIRRDISSKSTFEDLQSALNEGKARYMSLMSVVILPKYFFQASDMLAHKVTSLLLQFDPDHLEPMYRMVGKTSFSWVTNNYQKDWFSGQFMFPVYWSGSVSYNSIEAIKFINDRLTSARVLELTKPTILDKRYLKQEDLVLWRIEASESAQNLKVVFSGFDGQVLVAKKAASREMETELQHIDILPPVAGQKVKSILFLATPLKVNPYLLLSGLLRKPYKVMLRSLKVKALATLRKTQAMCQTCDGHVYADVVGKITLKQCPVCISKVLLSKELD